MPFDFSDPNATISNTNWALVPASGSAHEKLQEAVRQPSAPSMASNYLRSDGHTSIVMLDMSTLAGVETVSQIKLWVYCDADPSAANLNTIGTLFGAIYIDGVIAAPEQEFFTVLGQPLDPTWLSVTFASAWTQAELNSLRMRLRFQIDTPADIGNFIFRVFAAYAEIAYTPEATSGESQSESTILTQTIIDSATGFKRASDDAGSVEKHSLKELIEADEYLTAKQNTTRRGWPLKILKIVPPSSTGD